MVYFRFNCSLPRIKPSNSTADTLPALLLQSINRAPYFPRTHKIHLRSFLALFLAKHSFRTMTNPPPHFRPSNVLTTNRMDRNVHIYRRNEIASNANILYIIRVHKMSPFEATPGWIWSLNHTHTHPTLSLIPAMVVSGVARNVFCVSSLGVPFIVT